MFQYKILNILFLNKLHFKFKKVTSPLSSFCDSADETLLHIFYTCNITNRLWNELQYFVSHYLYIAELTSQSVLFQFLNVGYQRQNFYINQPFTTNFQALSVYVKGTRNCLFY